LALGGVLASSKLILENVSHGVLLRSKLRELSHPLFIISSLLADPSELEDTLLLLMIKIQMLGRIVETI
jgi:hypothetical protein